jgi:hypothetical protein
MEELCCCKWLRKYYVWSLATVAEDEWQINIDKLKGRVQD